MTLVYFNFSYSQWQKKQQQQKNKNIPTTTMTNNQMTCRRVIIIFLSFNRPFQWLAVWDDYFRFIRKCSVHPQSTTRFRPLFGFCLIIWFLARRVTLINDHGDSRVSKSVILKSKERIKVNYKCLFMAYSKGAVNTHTHTHTHLFMGQKIVLRYDNLS